MVIVGTALLAAAGSAGSSQQSGGTTPRGDYAAPAPRAMEPQAAIGLWRSSFGPVKVEQDPNGAGPTAVQGAWRYMRDRTEVVGVFWGNLRGNVLEFEWQEPGDGGSALRGSGYLVFDPNGQRFSGKWWTSSRDRSGDWSGWRQDAGQAAAAQPQPDAYGGQSYGGQTYGGQPAPPPPQY